MHVPDGFLGAGTSVATAVAASGVVGVALARSRRELGETGATRAGLTACFVFAAQMVNFPVGAGTSGHLIGGVLAAALMGPWTAVLVLTCVLLVQALLFADGGITALGTNVLLMGAVPSLVAALAWPALRRWPVAASAVAALVSVPAAALAFSGLYAVGGQVPVPVGTLTAAMVGTHAVIGVGEALITAAVLGAVLAVRPDLVRCAAGRPRASLVVAGADGDRLVEADLSEAPGAAAPLDVRGVAVALGAAVLVGGGLSLLASASPDGLESVAARLGFEATAARPVTAGSPLADYGLAGLGSVGTVVAGLLGVLVTLAVAYAVARVRQGRADR